MKGRFCSRSGRRNVGPRLEVIRSDSGSNFDAASCRLSSCWGRMRRAGRLGETGDGTLVWRSRLRTLLVYGFQLGTGGGRTKWAENGGGGAVSSDWHWRALDRDGRLGFRSTLPDGMKGQASLATMLGPSIAALVNPGCNVVHQLCGG